MSTTDTKVERFDWRQIITASDDVPPEIIEVLDRYFEPFAALPMKVGEDGEKSVGEIKCVECGAVQNPGMMGFLVGNLGFQWGLAHGEGRCSKCGWPARAMHYVKDPEGHEFVTLRHFVIQYHPDFVTRRVPGT